MPVGEHDIKHRLWREFAELRQHGGGGRRRPVGVHDEYGVVSHDNDRVAVEAGVAVARGLEDVHAGGDVNAGWRSM